MNLIVEDLSVTLSGKPLLPDVSFRANPGELIGLVGPNGAGKSSLIKALAGLWPSPGHRLLGDTRLDRIGALQRARLISYLPQDKICDPYLSVREVAALGRLPWRDERKSEDIISQTLRRCQVDDLSERRVGTLSGGQKARALLARVLATEAPLILADEPTTALDLYHQRQIMQVLKDEAGQARIVIAALHDLQLAQRFCDRLIILKDGQIYADGKPQDVLTDKALRDVFRVSRADAGLD